MTEYQEPSLVYYARFYSIAIDHQAINSLDLIPQSHESIHNTLADPLDAPILDLSKFCSTLEKELQSEKLEVPKDAARFLSSVIQSASAKSLNIDWDSFLPDSSHIRNLRLEPPLLKRDFGLDMASIGTESIALDPVTLHLPREEVDERDEGLAFPEHYGDLADRIWNETATEKLDCSREDLKLLQEIRQVKEPTSAYIIEEICEKELGIKGNHFQDLSSTFLQGADFSSDINSSQRSNLPLFGDLEADADTDLTVNEPQEELDTANTSPQENNALGTAITEHANESSNKSSSHITDINSTGTDDFRFRQDLRESIYFDDSQEEQIYEEADYYFPTLRANVRETCSESLPSAPNTAGEMLDDYTFEVACSSFEALEAQMNQSQHSVNGNATATLSYSKSLPIVPARDISVSNASEDMNTAAALTVNQTSDETKTVNLNQEKLSGVDTSKGQTTWLTDSSLVAVIVSDKTADNDRVEQTIIELSPTDTVSEEKSEGKTIPLKGTQDIETKPDSIVPKQPKSHLNPSAPGKVDSDFKYVEENANSIPVTTTTSKRRTKKKISKQNHQKLHRPTQQRSHQSSRSKETGSCLCSSFSALGSLSSFMEIRGAVRKRQKIEQSPYFSTKSQESTLVIDSISIEVDRENFEPLNKHGKVYIPSPDIKDPTPQNLPRVIRPFTLVLSTGLLKTHCDIIASLENLAPAPVLIFRDYETPMSSKLSAHNGIRSGFFCEADIIISPTTGVLLTTTQATTQLYLPGHKPCFTFHGFPSINSPLRERIAMLSLRYDRVYVLICHASSASNGSNTKPFTMAIDPRTLSSVQSLIVFCASLGSYSTIVPLLVPSAQHNILEWVITLANKHTHAFQNLEMNIKFTPINAPKNQNIIQSLHDETSWELFLRRAGLNPFAALAVLDFINKRRASVDLDASDSTNPENCGLKAPPVFIEMDPCLRRQLFIPIIGTRALDRFGSVIEREWLFEEWGLGFQS